MFVGWNDSGGTRLPVALTESGLKHVLGEWRADIYDYARWEYGTKEAAGWILRELRAVDHESNGRLVTRVRQFLRLEARDILKPIDTASGAAKRNERRAP